MPMPPPPAGWSRFQVKSAFGAGRDFRAVDPGTGVEMFTIDGHIGTRPKAEVKDAAGKDLYRVRGTLLGIPKRVTISDADGTDVASLKAAWFSPISTRMTLDVTFGEPWELTGEILEKNYAITRGGAPIVQITQKWVTVRDTYTLDVVDEVDPGLALAVMWAVDRWVERD